jgi:hypothetical protein
MTPAERARQIDKEEFEAACAAIRQRAFAHAEECRMLEHQKVRAAIGTVEAMPAKQAGGKVAKLYTYDGTTLTVAQWAKRLGLCPPALYVRCRKYGSMEIAIAMGGALPSGKKAVPPGVSSDFARSAGTGAGSTAQETPNLTFSQEAAE